LPSVSNVFTYQVDYGDAGFQPGGVAWRSFGPSDAFKDSAIVITAIPSTLVAGTTTHRAMALQVSDTFVHQYPDFSVLGFVDVDPHVGVWLTNTGQSAIRYVTFKVAVIKA
jgi:hypothetical protein